MKKRLLPAPDETFSEKEETMPSSRKVEKLIKAFRSSGTPMEEKIFSTADVVSLVREDIESLMRDNKYDYVVSLFYRAGIPISENSLKMYYAKAQKEAREGHTEYDTLKQLILDAAEEQDGHDGQDGMAAEALPSAGISMDCDADDADGHEPGFRA